MAEKIGPGWTFRSWTDYYLEDSHTELEIEDAIWELYETALARRIQERPSESPAAI